MRYYNTERRHSGLDYRAPGEYLTAQGIHPRVVIETGPPSGSVSGAQVPFSRATAVAGFDHRQERGRKTARPLRL